MRLSLVVCIGCYWIITAPSVDLVIRSTVSIMFVQNVDEVGPSPATYTVALMNTQRQFGHAIGARTQMQRTLSDT